MSEPLEQQLQAAFVAKLDAVSPDRAARLRAFDYQPRRHLAPVWPSIGGALALTAAAITAAVLALSSGTPVAFAGWTPTPAAPTVAALAAARTACGGVAASQVLAADARGPYTAIVYTRGATPWQCVTEGREALLNQTPYIPPNVVINPAAGKVTLPLLSRTVRGAAKAQLNALYEREAALTEQYHPYCLGSAAGACHPKVFFRKANLLEAAITAISYGPDSFAVASGSIGAGVTGVSFVLADGAQVSATVHHGWYLAWWPGSSALDATDPASIRVTTAAGTTRAPYSSSLLQGFYGPCPVNEQCSRPGPPAVRVSLPARLRQRFALFRDTKPTPLRSVAAVDRRGMIFDQTGAGGFLQVLGLDHAQMREVSFGRNGIILVVPGTLGVCLTRTFPAAVDMGGNGASCDQIATVLGSGFMMITDGSTLEGLVPDGNRTVTAHFGSGRTVTVPVKNNAVLAPFASPPTFVTWKSSAGKPVRWP